VWQKLWSLVIGSMLIVLLALLAWGLISALISR
jgi:hypothetical protein